MISGDIVMSRKEITKLEVIVSLVAGKTSNSAATKLLGLSRRQIIRIRKRYRLQGVNGLVSKKRNKSSNNRISEATRQNILSLVKEKYIDFGPTFLGEKLLKNHAISVSKETLRQLMISESIWTTKRHKKARIHQLRERRGCFGELIQIDGSPHN